MVRFNELKITPNDEYLIIDVSVEDSTYYNDVILDSIIVDTQDTYVENGPSSNSIFSHTVTEEDDLHKKHAKVVVKLSELNTTIKGTMFFVYVITSGEPSPDTPCELKQTRVIGTAVNMYPLYKQAMLYTRELSDGCVIPKGFVDCVLRIKALDLAIRTGNYIEAIRYWNKLFKRLSLSAIEATSTYCTCYGENN